MVAPSLPNAIANLLKILQLIIRGIILLLPLLRQNLPSQLKKAHPHNQSEENERKLSKRSLEAEEEVNRAIDAIIQFNNTENLAHNDKWHIGIGSLRKLTQRGDTVIKRVLEPRATEIQHHHAVHHIGQRHNSKGKDYPSIHEIIDL